MAHRTGGPRPAMISGFTPEQEAMRESIRRLVARSITPQLEKHARDAPLPKAVYLDIFGQARRARPDRGAAARGCRRPRHHDARLRHHVRAYPADHRAGAGRAGSVGRAAQ
ncbi:MAG: hypothetical protein WDO24_08515 [Pseudomonadota bacterium]